MKTTSILNGLMLILFLIVLSTPFYYSVIFISIIGLQIILLLSNKNNRLLYASLIVISVIFLLNWPRLDFQMHKGKYYSSFESLSKFPCVAGYNLIENKWEKTHTCQFIYSNNKDSMEINKLLLDKRSLFNYLKKIGCIQIEVSNQMIQYWFKNEVITLEKDNINDRLHIDISELN